MEQRPLFALLIGIDKYESAKIDDLDGAISDAQNVGAFFSTHPNLPFSKSNITYLLGPQATRLEILKALEALGTNPSIQRDDPILIFFAGHGSSGRPPKVLGSSRSDGEHVIEFIVPYDCDEYVAGIPDRTIGKLLDLLAKQKGDNITVIFDCCHSASATRSTQTKVGSRSRGTALPMPIIPANLDIQLLNDSPTSGGRGGSTLIHQPARDFEHAAFNSHILLAACGINEEARETNGSGLFTRALLETLKQVVGERLSYRELMMRIPDLPGQNPQCQGLTARLNRRLFSTETAPTAALARALGAESAVIFQSLSDRLGFEATPCISSSTNSGQLLTTEKAPSVRIYIELDQGLNSIIEPLRNKFAADGFDIRSLSHITSTPGDARLRVSIARDNAVFDDLTIFPIDSISRTCGAEEFKRLPFTAQPKFESLSPIIFGAIHWYYHLLRKPARHALSGKGKVIVDFTELEPVYNDMDMPEDLIPSNSNLASIAQEQQSIVDIVVDSDKLYGQTIKNPSKYNMYPHLFWFNNSDFSITSDYLPPISTPNGTPDPLLRAEYSLPIGYGTGGAAPWNYELLSGQNVDRGFFKLFLTTKYVDLSSITQQSPFEKRGGRAQAPAPNWKEKLQKPTWDEITMMIMQHRG